MLAVLIERGIYLKLDFVELHLKEVLQLLLLPAPLPEHCRVAPRLQSTALLLGKVFVGQ
jgi:hypothetical protein